MSATDQIRTLIVDDSARMREAIKELLRPLRGCLLVGEGANGLEAVELAWRLHPDLVVMDINMPVMGGMQALSLLRRELSDVQVVMVSSILEKETRDHSLGLGAYACLEKGPELWERLPAIVSELSGSCPAGTLARS